MIGVEPDESAAITGVVDSETSPGSEDRTIAALIPSYNAAPWIESMVRRTRKVVSPVYVVDDGSTDATGAVAAKAGAELLRHERNRGKGAALKTGLETLFGRGYAAVVTLDADAQHLPEEIPKLVAEWEKGAELVLGSRADHFAAMSVVRRISNWVSSWLISIIIGSRLPDLQTGFRIYSAELAPFVARFESGFEAETGIVIRLVRARKRIRSTPVEMARADGRSTSHFRPFVDSLRIAATVTRARFERPLVGTSIPSATETEPATRRDSRP